MWTLHSKDPVNHWVPLSTVASFKRMRRFLPKPEQGHDLKWLAEAVKEYSSALEVSTESSGEKEGEEIRVRRTAEVVPPKSQFERSVYAVRPPSTLPFVRVWVADGVRRKDFQWMNQKEGIYRFDWNSSLTSMRIPMR